MIVSKIIDGNLITEASDSSRQLHNTGSYGTLLKNGQVKLSFLEGLYLVSIDKLKIYSGSKELTFEQILRKGVKEEKGIYPRYIVYKDLRDRGYIVKTALKFGGDFRVYDKGIRPGDDHAKWVVFPVKESNVLTWYEFSAKNRVAHSTKKRLMLGIVDDEGDVTYYEVKWLRP